MLWHILVFAHSVLHRILIGYAHSSQLLEWHNLGITRLERATCTPIFFLKNAGKWKNYQFYLPDFHKFFDNTSQKFWHQSPSPHDRYSLQVSDRVSQHKLWCRYSANMLRHWVGVRGLIYFCKVDHSRIFINISRNWLSLHNWCAILSQNL